MCRIETKGAIVKNKMIVSVCLVGMVFSCLGKNMSSERPLVELLQKNIPYIKEETGSVLEVILGFDPGNMEQWLQAAMPLMEYEESIGVEEESENESFAEVTENEKFQGFPEDYYVTVLQSVNKEIEDIKSQYPEQYLTDFSATSSLYLYSSSVLKTDKSFIDGQKFMNADLTTELKGEAPKVLICHTHAHEGYADKEKYGILDVGAYLGKILSEEYGVSVIHHTVAYDKEGINGAYDRLAAGVEKVLEAYPSIEVVIDMHRDGVAENVHLTEEVDGKKVAQLMLVNGVSRQLNSEKELVPIPYLENPYVDTNLALSFRMKMASETLYPGLMRPIYLARWRYSTHLKPLSLLLEVGAQTNTLAEAKAAMEPFAKILYTVLSGNG